MWDAARVAPYVLEPGMEPVPLVNLHVHSKRLVEWASPRESGKAAKPAGLPSEAGVRPRARKAVEQLLGTASSIRRRTFRSRG